MLNIECPHPAGHVHGTYVCYVIDRCRCTLCVTANREYENDRRRQRAYGRPAHVDAGPVRAHVETLQAAGMGWKRVAARSGIGPSVVWSLLYGNPGADRPPSRRVRAATANALLAVPMPTMRDLGASVTVPAVGTRRRLQALMCMGWSVQRLADDHGVSRQRLDRALMGGTTSASTAVAVDAMYEALSMVHATGADRHENASVTRTRRRAERERWTPPLGWDDEQLDDPAAVPDGAAA